MLILKSSWTHLVPHKLKEIVISTEQFAVLAVFDGSNTAFTMKSSLVIAVVLGIIIAQSHEGKFTITGLRSQTPRNFAPES